LLSQACLGKSDSGKDEKNERQEEAKKSAGRCWSACSSPWAAPIEGCVAGGLTGERGVSLNLQKKEDFFWGGRGGYLRFQV
jgi:hypothetical protein